MKVTTTMTMTTTIKMTTPSGKASKRFHAWHLRQAWRLQTVSAWAGLVSFGESVRQGTARDFTFRQLGLIVLQLRSFSSILPGGDVSWRVDAVQDGQSINKDTPARIPQQ
jgi:hypothetical protein